MSHRPNSNVPFASPVDTKTPLSSVALQTFRNSNLHNVWDDDYFDSGDPSTIFKGSVEATSIPSPPPATLRARPYPLSTPLPAEEESRAVRQPRTQQRSLTALLPFRSSGTRTNSSSPQRSPTKEQEKGEVEFMPTLTGDNDGTIRVAEKPKGGLSSWFTGSSAPVSVGIPIGEQEPPSPSTTSPKDAPVTPERPPAKLKKRPTLPALESSTTPTAPSKTPNSGSASRFNFFSPKPPTQTKIQLPHSMLENDEFLTLDITSALFPTGLPSDQDPFSPSAFKNLLMNAEGLLLKLQTSYKLRTLSLHELSAEKDALSEELEEAETRAQSLRTQLEDLAASVSAQDEAMEDLVQQLAVERQARAEEKAAREKSIALIHQGCEEKRSSCCSSHEDLGISSAACPSPSRERWHQSGGSVDLGAEGESDSESAGAESVFSRSRSPTLTVSSSSAMSTMTTESTPEIMQASFGRVVSGQAAERQKVVERPSALRKILKGISTTPGPVKPVERDILDSLGGLGSENGCENCRGKDASVAWDAVGLLRAENKGLKERVGTLEGAVEGALDLCAGLRL